MGAKEKYARAYEIHYKSKRPFEAYWLYKDLVENYSDSKEASYAITQINNIEALKDFSEEKLKEYKDYSVFEKERNDEQEKRRQELYTGQKEFLITTGYNFEGYKIKKYLGLVSGEIVLGTGFLSEFSASFSDILGTKSDSFTSKMVEAKNAAKNQLISNAIKAGGNAVIGIDFDYITFAGNMLGVSANGTVVWIDNEEK